MMVMMMMMNMLMLVAMMMRSCRTDGTVAQWRRGEQLLHSGERHDTESTKQWRKARSREQVESCYCTVEKSTTIQRARGEKVLHSGEKHDDTESKRRAAIAQWRKARRYREQEEKRYCTVEKSTMIQRARGEQLLHSGEKHDDTESKRRAAIA